MVPEKSGARAVYAWLQARGFTNNTVRGLKAEAYGQLEREEQLRGKTPLLQRIRAEKDAKTDWTPPSTYQDWRYADRKFNDIKAGVRKGRCPIALR